MVFYTRLKSWWNGRKDGKRNYPAAEDSGRPEYENELIRGCQHVLANLAMRWHEAGKEAEATVQSLKRKKEKATTELEKARKGFASSETALGQAEKLSQNIEHVSPGLATYLLIMGVLMVLEFPFNAAVFEAFGKSTIETWIYALVPSIFVPILAHFMGRALKQGLKKRTALYMFLISVTILSGLLFVQAYAREKDFSGSGYQQVVGFSLNSTAVTMIFLFLNLVIALVSLWLSYDANPSDPATYSKTRKVIQKAKRAHREASRYLALAEKRHLVCQMAHEKAKAARKHAFARTMNEAEKIKNGWANHLYYYRHINMQNRKDRLRPVCFSREPEFVMPESLRAYELQEGPIEQTIRITPGDGAASPVRLVGRG
ncbi:MAG: hypothetical protein M0Z61_08680 [Nitrospiraceae bacterium]|nr:hypothetical protein [Nitrospiraceae bacterium]